MPGEREPRVLEPERGREFPAKEAQTGNESTPVFPRLISVKKNKISPVFSETDLGTKRDQKWGAWI